MTIAAIIMGGLVLMTLTITIGMVVHYRNERDWQITLKQMEYDQKLMNRVNP